MAAVAAQQSPRMAKKDKKKGKKAKASKAADLVPNKRVSEEEEEEDSGLEMACEKQSIDSTEDNMDKGESTPSPSPAPAATKEKTKGKPGSSSSSGASKEIRAAMAAECAFASVALRLLVIPKHKMEGEEADNDDGDENLEKGFHALSAEQKKQLFGKKGNRASSLQELQQRYVDKMSDLKGNRADGRKNKKGKLSKVEKKKMMREAKKKLGKAGKLHLNQLSEDKKGKVGKGNKQKSKVFNEQGKMVFSKFDFTASDGSNKEKKQPGLDAKSALARLEAQKETARSLAAKGKTERVKKLGEKTAWKAALDKAEGVKVKDDAGLLKKSIKRLDQRKKSTKKKWAAREESVDKRKAAVQHKRTENIKRRKDDVKAGKAKKMAKKGRAKVPGFK